MEAKGREEGMRAEMRRENVGEPKGGWWAMWEGGGLRGKGKGEREERGER